MATVLVFVVVLVVGVALSLGARSVHNSNEDRLLRQRVKEVGAVVTAAIPNISTPLVSVADVAEVTHADRKSVSNLMTPLIKSGQFTSVSVWSSGATNGRPLVVGGARPLLEAKPSAAIRALLFEATRTPGLTVAGLVDSPTPELTYAFTSTSQAVHYVVYAEAPLPKNRTAVIQKNSAYFGLGYALYLGSSAQPENLLIASTSDLPLRGRLASVTIPFGDDELHVVMTPTTELGGGLLARLQWLLLAAGIALAVAAAALTERLVRQRERARSLADENATLYSAQRTVAQTLQHSLLPETLPQVPGLAIGARYIAGVADIEIGGDWYDVVDRGDASVLFVVGDVSGRGLPAATIMASLRYAIRAYAAQGDDPATILTKLAELISVGEGGHFATVLCGRIDVARHEISVANAGHPQPLLLAAGEAAFVSTNIGVPIGVANPTPYASVTVAVPAGATLLAFTDGLVERRGELLDVGLERLRNAANRPRDSIESLLGDLADNLPPDGPSDDVAILGVKWST